MVSSPSPLIHATPGFVVSPGDPAQIKKKLEWVRDVEKRRREELSPTIQPMTDMEERRASAILQPLPHDAIRAWRSLSLDEEITRHFAGLRDVISAQLLVDGDGGESFATFSGYLDNPWFSRQVLELPVDVDEHSAPHAFPVLEEPDVDESDVIVFLKRATTLGQTINVTGVKGEWGAYIPGCESHW